MMNLFSRYYFGDFLGQKEAPKPKAKSRKELEEEIKLMEEYRNVCFDI